MEGTIEDQLRALGVRRGVLVQMAQRGQIIELRCEMPKCYCHKGRGYFDERSHPQRSVWAPSADHYPKLAADGGKLDPWNVRLGHVFCNQEDSVWRGRISRMLKDGKSLDEIAESDRQGDTKAAWQRQVDAERRAESVRLLADLLHAINRLREQFLDAGGIVRCPEGAVALLTQLKLVVPVVSSRKLELDPGPVLASACRVGVRREV